MFRLFNCLKKYCTHSSKLQDKNVFGHIFLFYWDTVEVEKNKASKYKIKQLLYKNLLKRINQACM